MKSLEKCLLPGLPNWLQHAEQAVLLDPNTTGYAGLGKALHILGVKRDLDYTLSCCGHPYLGKGLLYEGITSVPKYNFEIINIKEKLIFNNKIIQTLETCRQESEYKTSVFSPLGWQTLTPLKISGGLGPRGCVTLFPDEESIAPTRLEPLQMYQVLPCANEKRFNNNKYIKKYNNFILIFNGNIYKSKEYIIIRNHQYIAVISKEQDSILIQGDKTIKIKIKTKLAEYTGAVLGYFQQHPFHGREGTIESVAITIGLGQTKLALGSAKPIIINFKPEQMEIKAYNSLRIAPGGLLTAIRLAIEDATMLRPLESCGIGLGHLRSSSSIALLSRLENKGVEIVVYSPVSKGIIEFRSRFPIKTARLIEDCHEESQLYPSGDLVRIPAPWGCLCRIEIEKSLFKPIFKRHRLVEGWG